MQIVDCIVSLGHGSVKQTRDLLGLVLDDPVILSLAPRLGTIDANTDAVRIVESLRAYVIHGCFKRYKGGST